jgi:hypothetical protein
MLTTKQLSLTATVESVLSLPCRKCKVAGFAIKAAETANKTQSRY